MSVPEIATDNKATSRALLSDRYPSRPIGRNGVFYEQLEERRKNHVPRFLFRFWRPSSGGGPQLAINSTTEIKPHAFMPGNHRHVSRFYDTLESRLHFYAYSHYKGKTNVKSPFSSWTSSLHVALCLAARYGMDDVENPGYVAIMDTQDQGNEVLVWHAPDLIRARNHEFLAWGHITGRGYKAIRWKDVQGKSLSRVFPELQPQSDVWGHELRRDMFDQPPAATTQQEVDTIRNIALLFGDFFLPVAAALICLRPRHFLVVNSGNQVDKILRLLPRLQVAELPYRFREILQERWLEPGMVETDDFPDVELWIRLFDLIVQIKVRGKIE